MSEYLDDRFLERVKRCYCSAITEPRRARRGWKKINARRSDIHAALIVPDNAALRNIFANPTTTDLYYGMDDLCRSMSGPIDSTKFIEVALASLRGRLAAYEAQRVLDILGATVLPSVIEIGPGMGRVAYLMFRAGVTDYATVDLPLGIAGQACFLGRALGPDKLWFEGEDATSAKGRIKLFFSLPISRRWEVAVNVDSMAEMPIGEAFSYARWLSPHVNMFFSINQKDAVQVSQIMTFAGTGECQLRRPCPAWAGYSEELYKVRHADFSSLRFTALLAAHGLRYCLHPVIRRLSIVTN